MQESESNQPIEATDAELWWLRILAIPVALLAIGLWSPLVVLSCGVTKCDEPFWVRWRSHCSTDVAFPRRYFVQHGFCWGLAFPFYSLGSCRMISSMGNLA